MTSSIPVRQVKIKNFLQMTRDGILAFVASGGDLNANTDAALSTYIYADDGSNVPPDAIVFPDDSSPDRVSSSPEDFKYLSYILGKYADSRGWDGLVVGDEL